MTTCAQTTRYVFRTEGVCPAEIHITLQQDTVVDLRFVGGGCPGHAHLVSRLLRGKPVRDVMAHLSGIECREGTSCPDQLARALSAALDRKLDPSPALQVENDLTPRSSLALVGTVAGSGGALCAIWKAARTAGAQAAYCVGGLTDGTPASCGLLELLQDEDVFAVAGDRDLPIPASAALNGGRTSEHVSRLPHVLSFQLGNRPGVAFFGSYLQKLEGFSDFSPFALEINMVCDLTRFMSDETVFPALAAMTDQFAARLVLFGQARAWGHWSVGGVDFIGVGPSVDGHELAWGLLGTDGDGIRCRVQRIPRTEEEGYG